ncbi:hypothetical protein C0J52_21901 [Blattella germanica]|nr:hypothetical protein C0J52_21901 [Blattella germanica]
MSLIHYIWFHFEDCFYIKFCNRSTRGISNYCQQTSFLILGLKLYVFSLNYNFKVDFETHHSLRIQTFVIFKPDSGQYQYH